MHGNQHVYDLQQHLELNLLFCSAHKICEAICGSLSPGIQSNVGQTFSLVNVLLDLAGEWRRHCKNRTVLCKERLEHCSVRYARKGAGLKIVFESENNLI